MVPKNFRSKYILLDRKKLLSGTSYILNIDSLERAKVPSEYMAQYIMLASRRSYYLYKSIGQIYLDLLDYPDLILSRVSSNPLLRIENDRMYFKYEEELLASRVKRNRGNSDHKKKNLLA